MSRASVPAQLDGIRRRTHPALSTRPTRLRQHGSRWPLFLTIGIIVALAIAWLWAPVALAASLVPLWKPGTYLVLFENDAELRPSGGFIGSYAVVTVHPNHTFSYAIQTNIYKIDNPFTAAHPITPPTPLKNVTPVWALRDSNWDIDFQTASQTITSFYEQETGQKISGVIGITGQAFRQLLTVLGPVKLSDGTSLTAGNFYNTLAYKIEKQYFFTPQGRSADAPKSLLLGLIPQLEERLLLPWNDTRVALWADSMLATKQIVASFPDQTRESYVSNHDWGDRIATTSQQFLALNNANIGGLKSSQYMTQAVSLAITTKSPSKATYTLTLARTHHGTGVWPDAANLNFTRIVVPAGATVAAATLNGEPATLVSTEAVTNRTALGFWVNTDPGTTQTLAVTFSVPLNATLASSFTWQKQPGVTSDAITVTYNGTTLLQGNLDRDVTVPLP